MDVCGCQTFDCRRLWCPWRVGFGRVGQYLLVRDSDSCAKIGNSFEMSKSNVGWCGGVVPV